VVRLRPDLRTGAILQSIYLGGSSGDYAYALAIHPITGDVYVAGETYSNNFPNTSGGAQTSNNGGSDAFVARLNSNLTSILQSTYVGGSRFEWVRAFAIHPTTGDVYVAGTTTSTDLPRTTGGAQATFGGKVFDAFVVRLNRDLTQILQSTYLGGNGDDLGFALTIHPTTGEVYVAGRTESFPFPGTVGGAQVSYGGSWDAFVARLNKELTQILQSTYLGGLDGETAYALAIHPTTGEVYVTGETWSNNFPKTTGGGQQNNGGGSSGGSDAFVARLTADLAAGSSSGGGSGSGGGGSGSGGGGGGGGCSMTGSSSAGIWNIFVWLSVPAFMLARRIRRR
jgi:hypothetical protein